MEKTLSAAKANGLRPRLVTTDFSPNMTGPVRKVFGEAVLQIDGYHVMQELNNGIRADLAQFRDQVFQAQVRDLLVLRDFASSLQKDYRASGTWNPATATALEQFAPTPGAGEACAAVTRQCLPLLRASDAGTLQPLLHSVTASFERQTDPASQTLANALRAAVPKRALTPKGVARLQGLVLKKLKASYLSFRQNLQADSTAFFHEHWALFFQPERLTAPRQEILSTFLAKYPELDLYRQMTLQVGSIYRKPIAAIDGSEIDALAPQPHFSAKLVTAINTIKAHKDSILRFCEVFKTDPTLAKACRANMEPFNRRFKAPFHHGLNCTKKAHLLGKLRLQLNCEVRWFLDDEPALNIQGT